MSGDVELASDLEVIECPFFSSCILPKIRFLCKSPDCKNCPDYLYKVRKI